MGDEQPWMRQDSHSTFDTGGTAAQIRRMLLMHGHYDAAQLVERYFIKDRVHLAVEQIIDPAALRWMSSPEQASFAVADTMDRMVKQTLLDLPKHGGSLTNLHCEMVEYQGFDIRGQRYEFHLFADRLERGQQSYAQRNAETRGLPEGTIEGEIIE